MPEIIREEILVLRLWGKRSNSGNLRKESFLLSSRPGGSCRCDTVLAGRKEGIMCDLGKRKSSL